jgi:Helix-turn-helix domain
MIAKKKSQKKKQPQRVVAAEAVLTNGEQRFMKPEEVAKLLRTTIGTLATWRARGPVNLPFIKVGQSVLYDRNDVLEYLASFKHTRAQPESASLGRAS